MKVLIDTPIWSTVLRRKWHPTDAATRAQVASLTANGLIAIIGPIRQEILSGTKERLEFERIRGLLRPFPDVEITVSDYEEAASFFNRCREKGIQGSQTDFLICAIAVRHDLAIFTTDRDFTHFAKVLPIALHQ